MVSQQEEHDSVERLGGAKASDGSTPSRTFHDGTPVDGRPVNACVPGGTDFSAMSSRQIKDETAKLEATNIHAAGELGGTGHSALMALRQSIDEGVQQLQAAWQGKASESASHRLSTTGKSVMDSAGTAERLRSDSMTTAQDIETDKASILSMPATQEPSVGDLMKGGITDLVRGPIGGIIAHFSGSGGGVSDLVKQYVQADSDHDALVKAATALDNKGWTYPADSHLREAGPLAEIPPQLDAGVESSSLTGYRASNAQSPASDAGGAFSGAQSGGGGSSQGAASANLQGTGGSHGSAMPNGGGAAAHSGSSSALAAGGAHGEHGGAAAGGSVAGLPGGGHAHGVHTGSSGGSVAGLPASGHGASSAGGVGSSPDGSPTTSQWYVPPGGAEAGGSTSGLAGGGSVAGLAGGGGEAAALTGGAGAGGGSVAGLGSAGLAGGLAGAGVAGSAGGSVKGADGIGGKAPGLGKAGGLAPAGSVEPAGGGVKGASGLTARGAGGATSGGLGAGEAAGAGGGQGAGADAAARGASAGSGDEQASSGRSGQGGRAGVGAPMGAAPHGMRSGQKLKRSVSGRGVDRRRKKADRSLNDRPEFLTETDAVWGAGENVSKPVLGD